MQHLVDTDQLSEEQIRQILEDTARFKRRRPAPLLYGKLLITLFFENSTRTRSSFEVAAKRLGADMVHLAPPEAPPKRGKRWRIPSPISAPWSPTA
jgi:aspartate carbamoyltransferase catalytic subunit